MESTEKEVLVEVQSVNFPTAVSCGSTHHRRSSLPPVKQKHDMRSHSRPYATTHDHITEPEHGIQHTVYNGGGRTGGRNTITGWTRRGAALPYTNSAVCTAASFENIIMSRKAYRIQEVKGSAQVQAMI